MTASKKKTALVIVESPTKARTISAMLGNEFEVVSSMGHVVDLPKNRLGIDIDDGFKPEFVVIPAKKKLLSQLKRSAKTKHRVYLATDPDREGEAISLHIEAELRGKNDSQEKWVRVAFHEITPEAIKDAFSHPNEIDKAKCDAQLARRVLDRVVGYFLSPFLWKKLARGLSAGRVQSVALRAIVERELEIEKFKPQEYWEIWADVSKEKEVFRAKLSKIDSQPAKIASRDEAVKIEDEARGEQFEVDDILEKEQRRNPPAPFTTSSLQQEAFNRLRFTAKKTMMLAQKLYEGVELGKEGPQGLITYMRTDSVNISQNALFEVRDLIASVYGKAYLPEKPRAFKASKRSQAAHEAIRPTRVRRRPEDLKTYLDEDELKLYELIWKRFAASQMAQCRIKNTQVRIKAGRFLFLANGSVIEFDGFLNLYPDRQSDDTRQTLPRMSKNDPLKLKELKGSQHFTKPPPRFSDASLVKFLEERGIGRPSTYVPIIQTLLLRNYCRRDKGYFAPTELGRKVCQLLLQYFNEIMDLDFTAKMEQVLDSVEEGRLQWSKVLYDFYPDFKKRLEYAQASAKKEVVEVNETCPNCNRKLVIKWGRKGKFLSCSGFPQCKFSKSISTGVKCPAQGCQGELVERRSAKGRFFYGCSSFPKCRHISNKLDEK